MLSLQSAPQLASQSASQTKSQQEAACGTARLLHPLPYLQTLREAVTKPRPLTARTETGATTSAIPVAGSTDFFAGVGAGTGAGSGSGAGAGSGSGVRFGLTVGSMSCSLAGVAAIAVTPVVLVEAGVVPSASADAGASVSAATRADEAIQTFKFFM